MGWLRVARLLEVTGRKTVAQLWAMQANRKDFVRRFKAKMDEAGLDGMICPAQVCYCLPSNVCPHLFALNSTA